MMSERNLQEWQAYIALKSRSTKTGLQVSERMQGYIIAGVNKIDTNYYCVCQNMC